MNSSLSKLKILITLLLLSSLSVGCDEKNSVVISGNTSKASTGSESNLSPVKILALGDSITQGGEGYPSYRRNLWFLLQDAGYSVDFVGSQKSFEGRVSSDLEDFDLDHEGHWAWELGEIDSRLEDWLEDYTADIVLLHGGTNDFDRGQSNDSTILELDSIVDKLRNDNADVIILIAKIIPMKNKDTDSFNKRIAEFIELKDTDSSPVLMVDQYQGYDPISDNHDNYHPNSIGEKKVAKKWFKALRNVLDSIAD